MANPILWKSLVKNALETIEAGNAPIEEYYVIEYYELKCTQFIDEPEELGFNYWTGEAGNSTLQWISVKDAQLQANRHAVITGLILSFHCKHTIADQAYWGAYAIHGMDAGKTKAKLIGLLD